MRVKNMKKGRLSLGEQEFINDNYETMNARGIAEELNRDPKSIAKYLKEKCRVGLSREEAASYELEDRLCWKELIQQFEASELELLKDNWGKIISQFKDDVTPTEEMQVLDLVKLDILMNRCLKQNREAVSQMSQLNTLVNEERSRDKDQQDSDMIFMLERQVATLLSSQENVNKDYRELQTKKNAMMKEMKATREQRVKRIEDSQKSFTGWIIHLMTNPQIAEGYGIQMEKMRLAMYKERDRLSELHTYTDGMIDQPFLTPDTVKGD